MVGALIGTLLGMVAGAIVGAALCADCELEAVIWMLAGSLIGGVVAGVAGGLLARRFVSSPRKDQASRVALLITGSSLLALGVLGLFDVPGPWTEIPWPWFLAVGFVLLVVLAILGAVGALRRR